MYLEMDQLKGIIYGRKSRDDQDSLEGQINACMDWCLGKGMKRENIIIFKDEGNASSEDWDREQFQNMLTTIQKDEPDIVVCVEQFRICRTDDFPKFTEILVEAECLFAQIESGTIQDFTNENDVLVSDVLTGIGKFQLTQIKKKLKRGVKESAKKGNWMGKKTPVGYLYDRKEKKLIPSKDFPIIRNMFELYIEGLSTKDIAYKFTYEGVTTVETEKPLLWSPAGISRLLNNIVYVGTSVYGKTSQKKIKGTKKRQITYNDESKQIIRENTHEPVVTVEEWELVQKIKEGRNSRPPALKLAKHAFSGLIICSECGAVHSFQKSKAGKQRISSCQTRTYFDINDLDKGYSVCKNSGSNLEHFEKLFYKWLGRTALEIQVTVDMIKQKNITSEAVQEKKIKAIKMKEKQIADLTKTYKNIQRNAEAGMYDEELPAKVKEVKKLKQQVKSLEEEKNQLETQETGSEINYLEQVLNRMKQFLTGDSKIPGREANEILLDFMDRIYYKKDGTEIEIDGLLKAEIIEQLSDIENELNVAG